jgi:preprotein translocase subunit Sec61beta
MTGEERRRIVVGVGLAIAGVLALLTFFATS